jgi:hypothetical protein
MQIKSNLWKPIYYNDIYIGELERFRGLAEKLDKLYLNIMESLKGPL